MDTNDLSIIYDKLLVIHQMMNNNLNEQARLLGYNTSEYLVPMDLAVHHDTDLTSLYSRLGMKKSLCFQNCTKSCRAGYNHTSGRS
ncbi:hypothetical protein MGH68_08905 [Erysipelothrix sp. D19-032]